MKRFQNILVAVDTHFEEHPALEWGVRLAERNQAKLRIIDVLPELHWYSKLAYSDAESKWRTLAESKQKELDALAEPVRKQGLDVTTRVLLGKTSYSIIHEVLQEGHDLVVRVTKGAHSRRTGFFGTTSMRLLRKCPCAVWLVRTDTKPRFTRVLAAIDPDPHDVTRDAMNHMIMELGQSVAEYENGRLDVVHAWKVFGAHLLKSRYEPHEFEEMESKVQSGVAEALDHFLSRHGLTHRNERVHLLCDELGAGHAIAQLAATEQIDLVVMGTIARTGLQGALMGNTAEQVLDHINCSVLAIKPDTFISPVTLP